MQLGAFAVRARTPARWSYEGRSAREVFLVAIAQRRACRGEHQMLARAPLMPYPWSCTDTLAHVMRSVVSHENNGGIADVLRRHRG